MTIGRDAELSELFRPRSIAVIGASNRGDSVGASLFSNLLRGGFRGVVYPVNPSWASVSGVRCYPRVSALPEPVDLGVVIVPAGVVGRVVDDLGRHGTKGVVVISAGFGEVGAEGLARERRLVRIVRRHGMSIIGPNCFGVLNTDPEVRLNATFSDALPPRGNIAFVSQSGALCAGILRYGIQERIGFSRFLSVGNRAGVDENDLLLSLSEDPATRVILLYIESLADGRRFLETARAVTERKPILVIKSGRTLAGERAARSHTGSLAQSGRDQVYDALFEQCGALRVETVGELFRAAKLFAARSHWRGPRLAILTNSGGPGILAADAGTRRGLPLAALRATTRARIARGLSPSASVQNPVDMTADARPEQFQRALSTLLRANEVDNALVIATPTGTLTADATAAAILAGRGSGEKPLVACLFGLSDLSTEVGRLEEGGVPAFTFPEEAVAALAQLARFEAWRSRPKTRVRTFPVDRAAVARLLRRARRQGASVLPEYLARSLVRAYGIPVPQARMAQTLPGALDVAESTGYPVALKVASLDISHKTDVGGVALGIVGPAELKRAWMEMQRALRTRAPRARIDGFEVEAMVPTGKEVLVGAQQDPVFGPLVVFGMGGIYVEVLKDVTFRLAPIRSLSAVHMVESVRSAALLQGVRGEPPSDLPALYEVIERVSQLIVDLPEVAELDLNPVIVRARRCGVVAVDARIVLRSPYPAKHPR
ncbi:MAG: acetate--CoA ligase family protein [Thermoplasmata archaeon]|nr:acetate--CoA ligase family protein [Thermoplasmata archaeon]